MFPLPNLPSLFPTGLPFFGRYGKPAKEHVLKSDAAFSLVINTDGTDIGVGTATLCSCIDDATGTL